MRKLLCFVCVLLLGFGSVGVVHASLYDRGGGLIYDDYLDITWLQDANYALTSVYSDTYGGRMTWNDALDWAANLVYQGYDDWRLPDAHNQDGSGPNLDEAKDSEMGHMFYNNLSGTANNFPGMDFLDSTTGETRYFQNLMNYTYWTGTRYESPNDPVVYCFDIGDQSIQDLGNLEYAWAVRDGDVAAPVPEPATILLLSTGLLGLAGIGRKKLKNKD